MAATSKQSSSITQLKALDLFLKKFYRVNSKWNLFLKYSKL